MTHFSSRSPKGFKNALEFWKGKSGLQKDKTEKATWKVGFLFFRNTAAI
jgi:hypothetical protein